LPVLRPSSAPTIADLYLAFRQAKTALYFEKRGVGLVELAAYEQHLPKNLKALQRKLEKGTWFDKLAVGETWIVPKPHRRWVFEYWPSRYQQFRAAPLEAAKNALSRGEQTLIINGDLASFYDTVEPSFMLGEQFVAGLRAHGEEQIDLDEYRRATTSLLRAYGRYRKEASRRAAIPITIGIPIGALTSRVVANLSLAPLDTHIAAQPGVLCYRRYVDDLVIVAKSGDVNQNLLGTIKQFLPLLDGDDEVLRLDVHTLGRAGSEFQLQKAKVRVHHLAGVPGIDFVEAVASDFTKAVSERRAFVDSATLVGDGVTHLIRAGEAEGSPLRVLRELP
jgi:Reverse transcriptase (RNA-dependent DNA polymerase)